MRKNFIIKFLVPIFFFLIAFQGVDANAESIKERLKKARIKEADLKRASNENKSEPLPKKESPLIEKGPINSKSNTSPAEYQKQREQNYQKYEKAMEDIKQEASKIVTKRNMELDEIYKNENLDDLDKIEKLKKLNEQYQMENEEFSKELKKLEEKFVEEVFEKDN